MVWILCDFCLSAAASQGGAYKKHTFVIVDWRTFRKVGQELFCAELVTLCWAFHLTWHCTETHYFFAALYHFPSIECSYLWIVLTHNVSSKRLSKQLYSWNPVCSDTGSRTVRHCNFIALLCVYFHQLHHVIHAEEQNYFLWDSPLRACVQPPHCWYCVIATGSVNVLNVGL